MLLQEVKILLWKDVTIEWRHRYAINGILVYTLSTIFVCYMSFDVLRGGVNPLSWIALFWIILLFSAMSAVSKSFVQENQERQLYYYSIANPQSIILSKIIYNTALLIVLSLLVYVMFSLVLSNPVEDQLLFIFVILLGSIGFSITLTLMSGIASKATNSSMLMAILSFPVIIPMVMMVVKLSRNAVDGIARSESLDEIVTLLAVDVIVGVLSLLLFPYLWRS